MRAPILAMLLASPAYSLRIGLYARDAAPYGTCNSPAGNSTWTNTDGFGLGEVYYEGVNEPINPPIGNMTWTMSFSIDISLVAVENPGTPYYLAQGLILSGSQGQNADVLFQVPTTSLGIGDTPVYYNLIIDELQERTTPGAPVGSKGKTASPYIFLVGSSSIPASVSGSSGPCGTLESPSNGMTWNNSNEFETATVTYQGIDEDYAGDGFSHVITFTVDIYLKGTDGSTFYLAKGIAPSDTVADAEFEVPTSLPDATYDLVIDEYQKRLASSGGTTTTSMYIYTSAASASITLGLLAVSSTPTMTTSPSAGSGSSSTVPPGTISRTSASGLANATSGSSGGTPIGAIVGGAVGGFAALAIAAGLLFLWYRKHGQRSEERQPQDGLPPPSYDALSLTEEEVMAEVTPFRYDAGRKELETDMTPKRAIV